jgi:uncharacterized protein (TIGR02996 family)
MTTAAGFLHAIRAEPDEDAHRLAFADWLDDQSDADRAEFIRVQCEVARLPDDHPDRAGLEVRERHLLARHAVEWAAPVPPYGGWEYAGDEPNRAVFRRGFLDAVELNALPAPTPAWVDEINRLLAAHPIRELSLGGGMLPDHLALLAGCAGLGQVESLTLWWWLAGQQPGPLLPAIDTLLRSGYLSRLRKLMLAADRPASEQAARWLQLPALARLEAVNDPSAYPADGSFLRALARRDFPRLRELTFTASAGPDVQQAAAELVQSPLWPRLTALTVANPQDFPWPAALARGRLQRLSVHAAQPGCLSLADALAAWSGSPTLEELHVTGGLCQMPALGQMLSSEALAGLRRLTLTHTSLTDDDLEVLARAPALAGLNRLAVGLHRGAGDRGLTALFGSPHLSRLTHLRVVGGTVSANVAEALANNPASRRLRVLSLKSQVSVDAPAALTGGAPFPDLHTVGMTWYRPALAPAALAAFLDSPKLPRLCVVPFSVESREVAALADVFRNCNRIAWAGGEMGDGGDGTRVAVRPENVYLPNHLDDLD